MESANWGKGLLLLGKLTKDILFKHRYATREKASAALSPPVPAGEWHHIPLSPGERRVGAEDLPHHRLQSLRPGAITRPPAQPPLASNYWGGSQISSAGGGSLWLTVIRKARANSSSTLAMQVAEITTNYYQPVPLSFHFHVFLLPFLGKILKMMPVGIRRFPHLIDNPSKDTVISYVILSSFFWQGRLLLLGFLAVFWRAEKSGMSERFPGCWKVLARAFFQQCPDPQLSVGWSADKLLHSNNFRCPH